MFSKAIRRTLTTLLVVFFVLGRLNVAYTDSAHNSSTNITTAAANSPSNETINGQQTSVTVGNSKTHKYYLVDQVRSLADFARLREMGVNTVIQQMSVDALESSWRTFMQAAKNAGINIVIYPAKANLRENCSMPYPAGHPDGNIDLLKPMINVLAEYDNWIGIINAHEPYWSCKMTEQEMAGIKTQLKEYAASKGRNIKVWNYVDNIDGYASLQDHEIDQIADVFITWQHCAGSAEGDCAMAIRYLKEDRARLDKVGAKAELVWIVQTFSIPGTKYAPKFTLKELQDISCQAIEVGLDGFGFYTWDAWYPENLVDWPELQPAISNVYNNCWNKSSATPTPPQIRSTFLAKQAIGTYDIRGRMTTSAYGMHVLVVNGRKTIITIIH